LDTLISLVRDGRSYGIHFILTAEQTTSLPGKLFSLFTERLTLKLADAGDYATVVGRGVPGIDDIPGRGFVAIDRKPLEFQTALPVATTQREESAGVDDTQKLVTLTQTMNRAWVGKRPEGINTLPTVIPLKSLLPDQPPARIVTILGTEDL